jgi:hypothetical protein
MLKLSKGGQTIHAEIHDRFWKRRGRDELGKGID